MEHAALPAISAIVNFAALAIMLVYFTRKPLVDSLQSRHEKWKTDLDESEKLRLKTEEILSDCESKMKSLQDEVSAIFETARKAAEKEKSEILAKARTQADRILEDAQRSAEIEKEFMRKKLQKEMLARAIEEAKKDLKSQVGAEEHRAFLQSFVDGVGVTRG